ncbi:MAG: hypothetical protein GKR77_05365 [Legionellales bacterium]|nr:hypothetical protein [Legionellales bacterium]
MDKSHSLLQGAGPLLVSQSQYYKLRASFIYTHKLGGNFNFLQHVMVRERGTVLAVRSPASTLHSLAHITPNSIPNVSLA